MEAVPTKESTSHDKESVSGQLHCDQRKGTKVLRGFFHLIFTGLPIQWILDQDSTQRPFKVHHQSSISALWVSTRLGGQVGTVWLSELDVGPPRCKTNRQGSGEGKIRGQKVGKSRLKSAANNPLSTPCISWLIFCTNTDETDTTKKLCFSAPLGVPCYITAHDDLWGSWSWALEGWTSAAAACWLKPRPLVGCDWLRGKTR